MGNVSQAVAKSLQTEYNTFRDHHDPFNLSDEVAMLRTLLIEVRDSIEDEGAEKLIRFGNLVRDSLNTSFVESGDWGEDEASEHADQISAQVVDCYRVVYGLRTRISSKEAVDIAKVVESLSKVSERYKKMADGLALRVQYDMRLYTSMARFVAICSQYVPITARPYIVKAAKAFIPNLNEQEISQMIGEHQTPALPEVVPSLDEDEEWEDLDEA